MARLIAPEAFGIFAVALTVWSVLGPVAEFGLGADLVRREDYVRHIPTVTTLGAVLGAAVAIGMFLGATPIAAAFGSIEAAGIVQLMSIPLVLMGLSVVPAALLQRSLRQGAVFAIDASSMIVSTVLMIILALHGWGPVALALGRIAGQAVAVVLQHTASRRWPKFGWDRTVARDTLTFGMPLAVANAISWAILSVDNLIVARSMGPFELGLYALAFNIASWPMSIAGQSVRVIALPVLSRLPGTQERAQAMNKLSGPIWAVCVVASLELMFLAPQVISVAYGEAWSRAAVAVLPLAAFGALRVIFDLAATYLIACGMTGRVLAVQLIWLFTLIPALLLGVDGLGLAGAGWAHVAVAVCVVLPAYLVVMRKAEVLSARFIGAWTLPTIAAIPFALALWIISIAIPAEVPALAAGATAGVFLYVLPLFKWWLRRLHSLGSQARKTNYPTASLSTADTDVPSAK